MSNVASSARPLAGVIVVELGHSLAAPYATHILGTLGAEVIKIEPAVGGDPARGWGSVRSEGDAVLFHAINAGKKSIAVDLREPADRDSVAALILERADVVVQNLKPGAVDRLGLDADTLRAGKPGLVYCSIGAFGPAGPLSGMPGYDPLAQAMCGMMSLIGHEGDRTSRVPVSINDMGSGMWAAIGIIGALRQRDLTGEGATVSTSLYETALSWLVVQLTDYLNSGAPPVRQGSANANIVPYQIFGTSDGELLIAAGNDRLFAQFAEAIGRPELATDPLFLTGSDRAANKDALIETLLATVKNITTADLQSDLEARGVPCGPVRSLQEVAECEQTRALDALATLPGGVRTVGLPLRIDAHRPPPPGITPRLGANNDLLKRDARAVR